MERSKANTLGMPDRIGASGGGCRKGAKSRRLPAARPTTSVLNWQCCLRRRVFRTNNSVVRRQGGGGAHKYYLTNSPPPFFAGRAFGSRLQCRQNKQ